MKQSSAKYVVYIVQCRLGTYYTGYTVDIKKRLEEHNSGKGAKYLRGKGPVTLVYLKRLRSLSAALKAEIKIKQLTRQKKEELINAYES